MSTDEIEAERKRDSARIGLLVVGAYLLIGAGVMFYRGEWFIGFPPQLDVAYFLLGATRVGAYVEAALAGILGGVFVWAALAKWNGDAS